MFIAVGTPPDEDGSADLRHVLAVAETIGRSMAREIVVVTKSTVPVGHGGEGRRGRRHATPAFRFTSCSNPEFLKEGAAVDDFMKPDRVVLGAETDHARSVMAELYAPFVRTGKPIIFMDIPSAEMTKYAANAMLATRISFMNDIAELCERVGANVDLVRKGIGSDERIGPAFLFPGPGYGGSCFPKDVKALVQTARDESTCLRILEAVEAVNDDQKHRLFAKLTAALGDELAGARVAVWGLAFKPNTDDMREAPALTLIEELARRRRDGRRARSGRDGRGERGGSGSASSSRRRATRRSTGADALVVVTDWNEYRHPDFARIKEALRRPVIVDGRNLYPRSKGMRALRTFAYAAIGGRAVVAMTVPTILVTGGAGHVGSHVVEMLAGRPEEPRHLAR